MKFILLMILLISAGCSVVVSENDIEAATSYCADKEGIYQIKKNHIGSRAVECKNGVHHSINAEANSLYNQKKGGV
jgi:hypothetical protein